MIPFNINKTVTMSEYKSFISKKKKNHDYHILVSPDSFTDDVNILLGPNGTGKSMTLLNLVEYFKKNNIKYLKYSTKHNDIVNSTPPTVDDKKYINALVCAFHSEGERMDDSLNDWAYNNLIPALKSTTDPIYVIFDELDSGLSYDRLKLELEDLCSIIKYEKAKNREIHYIFTCNSFEMYEVLTDFCLLNNNEFKTIFVPTNEEISLITDYKEFKKLYVYYFDHLFS